MVEIEKEEAHGRLWEYWRANISVNYKKISAILGSMVITVMGLTIYGVRTDLDVYSILMTIIFAMQPFLTILINLMFKGESELKDKQIILLKQDLIHNREVSEYKLQLVALKATADWDKYNELLRDIDVVKTKTEEKKI